MRCHLRVSERRACRVIGRARSTHRRQVVVPADEPRLVDRMIELATAYGRYGLSADHRAVAWGRMARESQAGGIAVAALFVTHGAPAHIRSNNGPEFRRDLARSNRRLPLGIVRNPEPNRAYRLLPRPRRTMM